MCPTEQTAIKVSPAAAAVLAAFVLLSSPEILAAPLLAALAHEWGHYLALRALGGRVDAVTVTALGAEMHIAPQSRLSYGGEIGATLAGPAVNLLLGAYNLLPVLPLDGGRMLLAALYLRLPEQTAWLIGRVWSLLVITCLLVFALWAAGRAGLLPLVMVLGLYARLALREKSVAFCGGNRYNK